jgi:hypothetical protein
MNLFTMWDYNWLNRKKCSVWWKKLVIIEDANSRIWAMPVCFSGEFHHSSTTLP